MSKIADDVIIVTSSLTKDMTGKEDQYRASAIRALITITDVSWYVCSVEVEVFANFANQSMAMKFFFLHVCVWR